MIFATLVFSIIAAILSIDTAVAVFPVYGFGSRLDIFEDLFRCWILEPSHLL